MSNDFSRLRIEGDMPWFDWLRGALGLERAPILPALFRVRAPGGKPVELVRLSGTFAPGGQKLSKTLVTASGLCMVEWPVNAKKLHVRVADGDSFAELEVTSQRPDPGRVIEVLLA